MADGNILDAVLSSLGEELQRTCEIKKAHYDLQFTDAGNAERLALRYRNTIRYVPGIGWHIWDGKRWATDEIGTISELAKEVTTNAIAVGLEDRQGGERLLKWGVKSQSAVAIRNMVSLAQTIPSLVVRASDLNADDMLITVDNGTIDLRTGKLGAHKRSDLITQLLPYAYDADAPCPHWRAALSTILGGDVELIAYVQRAIGYTLTASVREQVLFILYGSGKNGKSTFTKTLQALLGAYAIQAAETLLLESRGSEHTTEKTDLRGARLAVCSETKEGKFFNEQRVKELTGGDLITGRRMHSNNITFAPTHKFWICTNHKPNVRELSVAIKRRLKFIPFTVFIPERDRDLELESKLRTELPGILAWAVEGCLAWQSKGLGAARKVEAATHAYFTDQDVVARFIEARCTIDPRIRVGATDLYNAYRIWAPEGAEGDPMTQSAFGKRLGELGYQVKYTKTGAMRLGLTLQ